MSTAEHQISHQKLSQLVKQADNILANYMFFSLIMHIVHIVSAWRGSNVVYGVFDSLTIVVGAVCKSWKVISFILEAIACASLNKKVRVFL